MTLPPTFSEVEGVREPMSIYFSSRPEAKRLPLISRTVGVSRLSSSQSGYTSPLAICRGRCRTFAAVHEPASGTKRTSQSTQLMSAFGGKADIARVAINVRF